MTRNIVVIGAGECGAATVLELRARGFDGRITLIGDESTPPYERPPLSKQSLTDPEPVAPRVVLSPERCQAIEVEYQANVAVESIDRLARKLALSNAAVIAYDRLIITTGSRARQLTVPGGEVALTLRTLHDAIALRSRLVPGARVGVIGGGFIGLELAASARTSGCEVTVVEYADRVLARAVPADIAAVVAAKHLERGVDLRCGVATERIEPNGDTHDLVLVDGTRFTCDVVVAGVGAVPNVELAAEAGLTLNNGIEVDGHLRTSDPVIFAAGDCCSFPHPLFGDRRVRLETWRNAYDQARVVAANAIGGDDVYTTVPWFWSDQYDLGIQVAGMCDEAVTTVRRPDPEGGWVDFGLDAGGRIVSAAGVGAGTSIAKEVRLAEMLIGMSDHPQPNALADPTVNLKSLVTAARRVANGSSINH